MVDERIKKSILPLIAGLILIVLSLSPSFIIYYFEYGEGDFYMLYGAYFYFENGALNKFDFYKDIPYVAVGFMYTLIFILIGIFLLISALLTLKNKNIPHIGIIWIICGIFLLLAPFLYRTSYGLLDIIFKKHYLETFMLQFDSLMLFPLIAILTIVPGALQLKK